MVFRRKAKEQQMIAEATWAFELSVAGGSMTREEAAARLSEFMITIVTMGDKEFREFWKLSQR